MRLHREIQTWMRCKDWKGNGMVMDSIIWHNFEPRSNNLDFPFGGPLFRETRPHWIALKISLRSIQHLPCAFQKFNENTSMIRVLSVKDEHPGITRNDNDSFTEVIGFSLWIPSLRCQSWVCVHQGSAHKQLISSREHLLFQFFLRSFVSRCSEVLPRYGRINDLFNVWKGFTFD
jgi:hypothetical protein